MHMPATPPEIEYPDSDGKPMADNTLQAEWIVVLFGNLRALYRGRADVFVAADLLWYPVEKGGRPPQAPDTFVVFGRPKGYRGSYRQWLEDNVPITVAFEVLSPSNTFPEMADKYVFYEENGVEEYYVYDPYDNHIEIYARHQTALRRVRPPHGYVSPHMGIRFDLSGEVMVVRYPDGEPFLSFEELKELQEADRQRADEAERLADDARKLADDARKLADDARKRADDAETRAARLAVLSRKLMRQQITPEEADELRRLVGG